MPCVSADVGVSVFPGRRARGGTRARSRGGGGAGGRGAEKTKHAARLRSGLPLLFPRLKPRATALSIAVRPTLVRLLQTPRGVDAVEGGGWGVVVGQRRPGGGVVVCGGGVAGLAFFLLVLVATHARREREKKGGKTGAITKKQRTRGWLGVGVFWVCFVAPAGRCRRSPLSAAQRRRAGTEQGGGSGVGLVRGSTARRGSKVFWGARE